MMANNTTCLKLFYEQVPGRAKAGRQAGGLPGIEEKGKNYMIN